MNYRFAPFCALGLALDGYFEAALIAKRSGTMSYRQRRAIVDRPKHPVKVHVWGAISVNGPASLCIFDGIMDAPLYVNIMDTTLLPFISQKFPSSHRFMADNDPKHTSKLAQQFLKEKHVNWWRTPAESPDLNPIENLWHEMKEYMRREVKPKNKEELINGIKAFWRTVTPKLVLNTSDT
ncbi:hypothetical protein EMCRGX_G014187 [Ephydatia muelleri]